MLSLYNRVQRRISCETTKFARILRARRGGACIDYNRDYKKTVLVVGSARSGTTWLGEILNAKNEFRDIFEPFYPLKVKLCRSLPRRPYLRPSDHDLQYLKLTETILTGRMHSDWSDQFNRRFVCERRLIKEVRISLMLGWLRIHFPEMPIVYILRHPCAVALSRSYLGWDAEVVIQSLLSQPLLVEDYLQPFLPIITKAESTFERHLIVWCIENYVPLRQLHKGDALVVFYEHLCTQPELEARRLADFLALDAKSMTRRMSTPSSQTKTNYSAIVLGQELASVWKTRLSAEMVEQAVGLLDSFGLSSLYTDNALPLLGSDDVFAVRGEPAAAQRDPCAHAHLLTRIRSSQ